MLKDKFGSLRAEVFNSSFEYSDGKYKSYRTVTITFEVNNRPLETPNISVRGTIMGPRGGLSQGDTNFTIGEFRTISENIDKAMAAYARYMEERTNNTIIDEILTGEEGTVATG